MRVISQGWVMIQVGETGNRSRDALSCVAGSREEKHSFGKLGKKEKLTDSETPG